MEFGIRRMAERQGTESKPIRVLRDSCHNFLHWRQNRDGQCLPPVQQCQKRKIVGKCQNGKRKGDEGKGRWPKRWLQAGDKVVIEQMKEKWLVTRDQGFYQRGREEQRDREYTCV